MVGGTLTTIKMSCIYVIRLWKHFCNTNKTNQSFTERRHLRIFLSLVLSILENVDVLNLPFFQFYTLWIWKFGKGYPSKSAKLKKSKFSNTSFVKMTDFEPLNPQLFFHTRSGWHTNSVISTLWRQNFVTQPFLRLEIIWINSFLC